MKKTTILLSLVALFTVNLATAQQKQAESLNPESKVTKVKGPVANYDRTVYDMGTIEQQVPKTATFVLTNGGTEPLIISSAQASCGCTGLQYDKEPILPGKTVDISATYNAAALGNFMKTITVRTNASDQPVVLQIKGVVVAKQ